MTIDAVRALCRALPNVTEDLKWGHDLCFCVHKKMFTVVSLDIKARPRQRPEGRGEIEVEAGRSVEVSGRGQGHRPAKADAEGATSQ
jgi:hypothetical protein